MSLIQIQDVSIEFAGNYIFRDISCVIAPNSRIGLIGPNGSGKTTLIKIMLGLLEPGSGTVASAKRLEVYYLAQSQQIDPDKIMIDYIHQSRQDIFSTWKQIEALSTCSGNHESNPKLEEALNHFHQLGGYEFENEVKYVLTSLGFEPPTWQKRVGDYSGGEQTRICLAAILLKPFDLLILDEPTNHLDIAMITWLEKYLTKQEKPYLIVSHDRTFLDNTVNTIYALEHGSLAITKGNYSSYSEARRIALLAQERSFERQQKFIAETMDFIRKNMAGQKTLQAKSRLKMLNRMEIIQKPRSDRSFNLSIQKRDRSGNDVFVLADLCLAIDESKILAEDISIRAGYQDKICILGPNGCGKTTLLKTLLNEHPVLSGYLKIGASLEIGYYDQHQSNLDPSLSVMETLWQIVPDATNGYVLSWLARFGFTGDDVEKKVSILSGGEKSRLSLSVLIHQNPNLLILDEPTNHLDIAMTDDLLEALKDYSGTILFVSHDRYLMKELASKYWVFHKTIRDNRILNTISEIDADHEKALELTFSNPELEKAPPTQRERKRKINPWYLEQLHKKIEDLNRDAAGLHEHLMEINMALADSKTYTDEKRVLQLKQDYADTEENISRIKEKINMHEEEYLELSYE